MLQISHCWLKSLVQKSTTTRERRHPQQLIYSKFSQDTTKKLYFFIFSLLFYFKGILVSIYPDFHRLPDGSILPYISVAFQDEDINTAPTVRMTGKRAHTMNSVIMRSYGAPPGMGVGVRSGTSGGVCQPKTHSKTVRIEGHFAVRHGDEWYMNNGNTIGKMNWIVEPWEGADEEEINATLNKMNGAQRANASAAVAAAPASATAGAAGSSLPPRPSSWPGLPPQTSSSSSSSMNFWWDKAGNLAKKGAGIRAMPLVGGLLSPSEIGDGTLTGALRREADVIAEAAQILAETGKSQEEVVAFHTQAWEALYEARPELFQDAVWGEVFPEIAAAKAENKKHEQEQDLGITEDNVRVTRPTGQREESTEKDEQKEKQEKRLKELEEESTLTNDGRTRNFEKDGTLEDAAKDFHSLNPDDVKTFEMEGGGIGFSGKLKDGSTVSVRPDSSTGYPTLQHDPVKQWPKTKFRYKK